MTDSNLANTILKLELESDLGADVLLIATQRDAKRVSIIDSLYENAQKCNDYFSISHYDILNYKCESGYVNDELYDDHTEKFKCVICYIPCEIGNYYITLYNSTDGGHDSDKIFLSKYIHGSNSIERNDLLSSYYVSEIREKNKSFVLLKDTLHISTNEEIRKNGLTESHTTIDTIYLNCNSYEDNTVAIVENCDIEVESRTMNKFYELSLNVYYDYIFTDSIESEMFATELDTNNVHQVLKVIQLIKNLGIPESDTIVNVLNFRHYSNRSLDRINIYGNKFSEALINLKEGVIPTGNSKLDEILIKYNLKLKSAAFFEKFSRITIWSSKNINTYPISLELLKVDDINRVTSPQEIIDNTSDVKLFTRDNKNIILFRYGSGDCMAGCASNRFWEFEINKCTVKFVRSYGDKISLHN